MTWTHKARAARLLAGIAVSAVVALGMTAGTANARWDHGDHRRDDHRGFSGGYWGAPPVVYGGPYAYGYYPPPGVGINLGGVGIRIR
jgi:hypothetical protein